MSGSPRFTFQAMTASRTTPTLCVLVIMMGPSRKPESSSQVVPVISPLPLSVNQAPKTESLASFPRGWMAVTPVLTGPSPTLSLPLPEMSVVCPTSTPWTSVMALFAPGVPSKGTPRSRARGLVWANERVPVQRRTQRTMRDGIIGWCRFSVGGSIKHSDGWFRILLERFIDGFAGRRWHAELETGGDCGIGGRGDHVAAEGETSSGGAGGRGGTRGAGIRVS